MMDQGVVITDGPSRVTLFPASASPGVGYPVRVEVRSGPFSGVIEAEARSISHFQTALRALHESMSGTARLEFWNEEHSITLKGNGLGGIEVIAEMTDGRAPWAACLTVRMRIDQSYLPAMIAEIGEVFADWVS